ncbi:hypothetical protein [Micromonospora sp. NPDC092111]
MTQPAGRDAAGPGRVRLVARRVRELPPELQVVAAVPDRAGSGR